MIDKIYLDYLDDYINNLEEDFVMEKSSNLLLEFLKETLNEICAQFRQINLSLNFINPTKINTNYNYLSPYFVQINYEIDEDLLKFSAQKSPLKNIKEKFVKERNLIPTKEEILDFINSNLKKQDFNSRSYKRNNVLLIKIKDMKFFVFISINATENFELFKRKYCLKNEILIENLLKKNAETSGNFFKLIKFFKAIEAELAFKNVLYESFIPIIYSYENITFNIPNKLLEDKHVYVNFLNATTFLENSDSTNFVQVDGEKLIGDNPTFLDNTIGFSKKDFDNFIKNNNVFKNNINVFLNIKN